jgi:hypothetical protein
MLDEQVGVTCYNKESQTYGFQNIRPPARPERGHRQREFKLLIRRHQGLGRPHGSCVPARQIHSDVADRKGGVNR